MAELLAKAGPIPQMRAGRGRGRSELGMQDHAQARRNMVDCQLRTFDVSDRPILAAMGEIPRERFVPHGRESIAYRDETIVAHDFAGGPRFMLAPMVLARMVQALKIEPGTRVLDVGGGAGYSAAILARLGARVVALESDAPTGVAERLRALTPPLAVETRVGPLNGGAAEAAPFDAILINGAIETRPEALLAQLVDGGRLACLQADGRACRAVLYMRSGGANGYDFLFDAAAPVLADFRREATFVF